MIPDGLRDFCAARSISDAHPSQWAPADHAEFQRWKIAKFKERWRAARENGDTDRTRRLCGRDFLIRRVREDLAFAMAPAPSDVYRSCPCHPERPWASPGATEKDPRTPGEVVAWLTATFARSPRVA